MASAACAKARRGKKMIGRRSVLVVLVLVLGAVAPVPAAADSSPWSDNVGATPRVGSNTPAATALAISQLRFAAGTARHGVVARDDVFADALSASPLTAEGPLLLNPRDRLHDAVKAELDRSLPVGAPVYLLGGTAAISQQVEEQVRASGFEPRRLAGADRIATSRAVATQVGRLYPATAGTRLLARAFGSATDPTAAWADSVTGGGYAAKARIPLVLTASDRLSADARAAINGASTVVLLGGTAALSDQVARDADQVAGTIHRAAGAARDATAVKIATNLWRHQPGQGRWTIVNGYAASGWGFGLAAAGLAADHDAPLLVTAATSLPPATADAVTSCDTKNVHTLVVGGDQLVSDATLRAIEARDGTTCGPPPVRLLMFYAKPDGENDHELFVIGEDGSGLRRLTHDNAETFTGSWSPDGRRLVYESDDRIFVASPTGGTPTQIATGSNPVWDPQGEYIAYDGPDFNGLWLVRPDGSGTIQLTSSGTSPVWSPDGRYIAFRDLVRSPERSQWDVLLLDLTNGDVRRITNTAGDESNVTFSRDSRRIAYTSADAQDRFKTHVYVTDLSGSAHRQVAPPDGTSRLGLSSAANNQVFSPGGSLVFHHTAGGLLDPVEVFAVNPDGSGLRKLASGLSGAFSPDGSRVAHDGGGYIRVVNADGSGARSISPQSLSAFGPVWQP